MNCLSKSTRPRGSVLVLTLIVAALTLAVVGGLLLSGRQTSHSINEGHRGTQNLALARGAVNRILLYLESDQNYQAPLTWASVDGTKSYSITFDTSQPDYSVNNLQGGASQVSSVSDTSVPAGRLELVVLARTGSTSGRYRFLLGRGLGALSSVGANGPIHFGHSVVIKSITSHQNLTPVEFSMVSNSTSAGVTFINNPISFTAVPELSIRSAGPIDAGIKPSVANWQEHAPPQALPALNISRMVTNQSGSPAPLNNPGGGYTVSGDCHLAGPVTVNGSVDLTDGSLYVDGDLTIKGGVHGYGAIFASGDISIEGGSAIVSTNARSGAALYSDGDINFTGLSASNYLDSLASGNPGLQTAWTNFQNGYNLLSDIANAPSGPSYSTPPNLDAVFGSNRWTWVYDPPNTVANYINANSLHQSRDLYWAKGKMGPGQGSNNPELLPQAGPNLHRATWHDDSYIRAVRDQLNLLPGLGTDPKIGHLVQAFEELGYTFRHDWNQATGQWDSPQPAFAFSEASFDQLLWLAMGFRDPNEWNASPGVPTYTSPANPYYLNEAAAKQNFLDLFHTNPPLDFSWLGRSYFQGILYASGSITLRNDATVIGGIYSGATLNLEEGTEFTFNQEYEDLHQNTMGPVKVLSFNRL